MVSYDIRVGDCLDIMRSMPGESVHCCVTSPPYFWQRDYGVEGQTGHEATPEEFVQSLVAVFCEVRRKEYTATGFNAGWNACLDEVARLNGKGGV